MPQRAGLASERAVIPSLNAAAHVVHKQAALRASDVCPGSVLEAVRSEGIRERIIPFLPAYITAFTFTASAFKSFNRLWKCLSKGIGDSDGLFPPVSMTEPSFSPHRRGHPIPRVHRRMVKRKYQEIGRVVLQCFFPSSSAD